MQFLKKLMLRRYLKMLRSALRDNYNEDEALHALSILRKVITSDNPIEYFSVRVMLGVRMQVQTHCGVNLVEILSDINKHLMDGSGALPEARVTYRHLQDVRVIMLYDWLVDEDNHVLDVPIFYQSLISQLNLLCDLVLQVEDADRQYILRKLKPLYSELLLVFIATLECGLRSI